MRSKFAIRCFLFVVLLGGCSFQDTEEQSGVPPTDHTLVMDPARGLGQPNTKNTGGVWALEQRARVDIEFCLRDPITGLTASEVPVRLEQGSTRTDHRGCVVWSPEVRYHRLAPERFLTLRTTLTLEAPFAGSHPMEVAVNPWTGEVADLRYQQPQPLIEDQAPLAQPEANWVVRDLRTEPLEHRATAEGTQVELGLHWTVAFERLAADGTRVLETARQGAFAGHGLLIEIAPGAQPKVLGKADGFSAVVENGQARVTTSTWKLHRPPTRDARLQMILRLEPRTEPRESSLPPWEGGMQFAVGRLMQPLRAALHPSVAGTFKRTEATLLPVASVSGNELVQRNDGPRPNGFYLYSWELIPRRDLGVDRATNEGRAGAQVLVCLRDSLTGEPVAHHPFSVDLTETAEGSNRSVDRVSDRGGCIKVDRPFEIQFPYFAAEAYLKRYLKVTSDQLPYPHVTRATEVYLNPWQRSLSLFYWDGEQGAPPKNPSPDQSALQLAEMSYQYPPQMDDLRLDSHLNLSHKDLFYLILDPKIYRAFSFRDSAGAPHRLEDLWPGFQFKVRTYYASSRVPTIPNATPYGQYRLISGSEATVEVNAKGQLVVPVALAFDFAERPLLSALSRVFLEIAPVGANGATPITVELPFDYLKDSVHGIAPIVSRHSLDEILALMMPQEMELKPWLLTRNKLKTTALETAGLEVFKPRPRETLKPFEMFLKHVNLPKNMEPINLDAESIPEELQQHGLTAEVLNQLLGSEEEEFGPLAKSALTKLCRLYFVTPPPIKPTRRDYERLAFRRTTPLYACHQPNNCPPKTDLFGADRLQPSQTNYQAQCLSDPARLLRVHRFQFVDRVNAPPVRKAQKRVKIEVMAGFFREWSESDRSTKGHTGSHNVDVGVTAKVGFEKFGNGVTAHASYNYKNQWYWGTSHALSTSDKNRYRLREKRDLYGKEHPYEIDVDTKNCLFIRPRAWMEAKHLTRRGRDNQAYFLCKSGNFKGEESWFYLTDDPLTDAFADREHRDLRDSVFLKLLRGKREFPKLKRFLENQLNEVWLGEVPTVREGVDHIVLESYARAKSPFGLFKDGGVFPGVLNHAGM